MKKIIGWLIQWVIVIQYVHEMTRNKLTDVHQKLAIFRTILWGYYCIEGVLYRHLKRKYWVRVRSWIRGRTGKRVSILLSFIWELQK